MNDEELGGRFAAELDAAWEAWRVEASYTWKRYKPMVRRYGAVGTVRRQVVKPGASPGFLRLLAAGRLDLTMEALVLKLDFAPLFTYDERDAARERLTHYGGSRV
jgi:hypothetical protein